MKIVVASVSPGGSHTATRLTQPQGKAVICRAGAHSKIPQERREPSLAASYFMRGDALAAGTATQISPLSAQRHQFLGSKRNALTGTNELLSSLRRAKPGRKQSGRRYSCTLCFSFHHKSRSGRPFFQHAPQHQL